MSRSLNKALLIGHLGQDAETGYTPAGAACTKFSLATSYRWKDKQTDEWKEETCWHRIVLWRQENLAPYLLKGKQVYVEGRISNRSYEKDGETKYITEIVADEVMLLGGKGDDDQRPAAPAKAAQPVSKPRSPAARPLAARPPAPPDMHGKGTAGMEITDDDVPF